MFEFPHITSSVWLWLLKMHVSNLLHLERNTWVLTDLICWLLMHQPKMWWFVCAEELSTKICALCNLQGWQLVTTWLWNYPWTQTQNIVAIGHMGRASAAILSQHGVMQVFYHSHNTKDKLCMFKSMQSKSSCLRFDHYCVTLAGSAARMYLCQLYLAVKV
jgi:hypothetical protein